MKAALRLPFQFVFAAFVGACVIVALVGLALAEGARWVVGVR